MRQASDKSIRGQNIRIWMRIANYDLGHVRYHCLHVDRHMERGTWTCEKEAGTKPRAFTPRHVGSPLMESSVVPLGAAMI
ncbi:uncharacterized protein LAJ45_08480 [Morchella importuna]|uniref:uncharacterized protein n=1 Tax=Morchella importuna TaxID=1174673 RepID=UPI001E8EE0EB|nr:uncharacterized protein LAJ45_08480 [Morchella importuna]KAH8147324.1 hypothetical protein LAJ45_08480 [Morchella importuna]